MSDRTPPIMLDHYDAVLAALRDTGTLPALNFQIGEWQRPKDADEKYIAPPYAIVRMFPSTGQFDGPISDSQVDIVVRMQIIGSGLTHRQATRILDLCRQKMRKSLITVVGRYTMDVRFMVTTGGVARDDDLPTPFFYDSDIYEILTTPA